MKFLVAFALAVAVAHADVSHVVSGEAGAAVVRSDSDVKPDGFHYGYETSNQIAASASGVVKDPNSDHPAQEVTGEYKYVGPDGVTYSVTYVANENGFQPQGAHLPVGPAIPEQIQRSLDYIASHPQPVEKYVATSAARTSPPVPAYKPPVAPAYKPPVAPAYKPPVAPAYKPPVAPAFKPPVQQPFIF